MSPQDARGRRYDYLTHRMKYLPRQIEAARLRVKHLEAEARRYGMTDLLQEEVQ